MTDADTDADTDMVRVEATVPVGLDDAFALLTDGMAGWWPEALRLDPGSRLTVEPAEGGAWVERAADGTERVWGRVLAWDPPRSLSLTWALGADRSPAADPERASTVVLRLASVADDLTTLIVEHRDLGRHGAADRAAVRRWVAGDEGWWLVLRAYVGAGRQSG